MPGTPTEEEALAELVAWADADDEVRALVLTSTRARQDGSADDLSDYDVIVAVRNAEAFVAREGWVAARGRPLVGWGDEHELLGETTTFRGVVYPDGVRVDFTIWPASLLGRVSAADVLPDDLDVGYRVLLDKDGTTSKWGEPTFRAHVPAKPTRAEYEDIVDEFWWDTTYIAKALWRGEIVFAKFVLEYDAKQVALRRLLEWRIELDHDWSLRPGAYGRGLERLLPAELVTELHATYVGSGVDDNWEALFRTTALFRRVATEVADALGYRYPLEADEAVTAQLEAVRKRPPKG
jgi:aminoglycoside 6-adenylyltransferase